MKICFIVGYWNSGTSLLVDLLRRHPDIQLRRARFKPNLEERTTIKLLRKQGFDFIDIRNNYSRVLDNGFEAHREPVMNKDQLAVFRNEFEKKFKVSEEKWLLIKNPWWFFFPNFIQEVFEPYELRTISILRNGKNQVVSKDYWLKNTETPERKLLARTRFWAKCIDYYEDNWLEREGHLDLRYETLCQQPKASLEACFAHLEVEPGLYKKELPTLPQEKLKNWDALDPNLKSEVLKFIEPAQKKLDNILPQNKTHV